MPEGLSAVEVGHEVAEHAKHARSSGDGKSEAHEGRNRAISIAEAVLLSVVTLMAAWSGYAAAKWSTESRVLLAQASAARTTANRASLQAILLRNFDSGTFDAWFSAYTVDNRKAEELAVRRFRPEFLVAFDAWRATHPEANPNAPKGPTYMPQYRQPDVARARALDARADNRSAAGDAAGQTADEYVRTTVFLASVLFIVGISTHFPIRSVRYALIGLGAAVLIASLIELTQLPGPPA
jgi:hypothetical protein